MELPERAPELQAMDEMVGLVSAMLVEATEAGAPVTPFMLASQSHYPRIADSLRKMVAQHNVTQKKQFQVPLKSIFTKAVTSVGIEKPLVSPVRTSASHRVMVSMVVAGTNTTICGDLSPTYELAETSAIKKAIVHLKETAKVILVDISVQKARTMAAKWRAPLSKVASASNLMQSILRKWRNCLDNMSLVEKFAATCLQRCPRDPRHVNSVLYTMRLMKGAASVHICNLEHQMLALFYERDKYLAADRAQSLLIPENKAYFDEVDSLSLLLKSVELDECQYSVKPTGNGLYIGVVQLSFPSKQVCIDAKEGKRTIPEAKNAAALEAIYYLEEIYKLEVIGSDHKSYIEAEQLVFVFTGLSEEFLSLAATMMHFWDDTLVKLNNFLMQLKQTGNNTPLKRPLVHRLEVRSM